MTQKTVACRSRNCWEVVTSGDWCPKHTGKASDKHKPGRKPLSPEERAALQRKLAEREAMRMENFERMKREHKRQVEMEKLVREVKQEGIEFHKKYGDRIQ